MAFVSLGVILIALASAAPTTWGSNIADLGYARYEGLHNTSLGYAVHKPFNARL